MSEEMDNRSDNNTCKWGWMRRNRLLLPILFAFLVIAAACQTDDDSQDGDEESETKSYTVSGAVSGSVSGGVTMNISGTGSSSTTTDSSGNYSFTVQSGSYIVTPSLSGYAFTPSSASVTVDSAAVSAVNFTSAESELGSVGDRTDYSSITLSQGGTYSAAGSGVVKDQTEFISTASDTPAVKVAAGGGLTLTHSKATKSGGATSSTENSGFYGFNSGVLVSSSSSSTGYAETNQDTIVSLTDCTITTAATGANGAFAFGQGAEVNLNYVTIITTGDSNSRGVDATYGGTVDIRNSKISTQGGSCAALASDRYQGASAPVVKAENVVGTTAGAGSPGIYCTGSFTISGCTLSASGSEAAVIEGLNSITLEDSSISGVKKWGIMIYQSMSGDSSEGTGTFSMSGGTLNNGCAAGPMFFVCNTDAVITLSKATLVNSSDMLLLAGTAAAASQYIDNVNLSWGTRGGEVAFSASNQALTGNIILCDSSSSVELTLNNSTLSGAINSDNKGTAKLTIGSGSTWTVTGTSYLTSLTRNGTMTGSGTVYVGGSKYNY